MSAQNIDSQSFEALKAQSKPLLIEFYKDGCAPCRAMLPIIDELASERDDIVVGKINAENEPELAAAFGVRSVPTIVVLQGGKLINRVSGLRRKAEVLEQYALIGSIYANSVLGIEDPRVALLNIGSEPGKGNMQTKVAYELMQSGHENGRYNFVGNVEASHIFSSDMADVVVCDGFVGNIVLKLTEGFYSINSQKSLPNSYWKGLNYECVGGIPVLGVNAPITIGHGKSSPLAVRNMILSTEHSIQSNLVENLKKAFDNR